MTKNMKCRIWKLFLNKIFRFEYKCNKRDLHYDNQCDLIELCLKGFGSKISYKK